MTTDDKEELVVDTYRIALTWTNPNGTSVTDYILLSKNEWELAAAGKRITFLQAGTQLINSLSKVVVEDDR